MASLADKDAYFQKLASKVCAQQQKEPKRKPFVHFSGKRDGPPKANKRQQKQQPGNGMTEKKLSNKLQKKASSSPALTKGPTAAAQKPTLPVLNNGTTATKTLNPTDKLGKAKADFSTVDILRKRLHEKIEESRGQGVPKNALSEEVQAKRAKRKMERERKKRKRKEFRLKKLAEQTGKEEKKEIKQEETAAPKPSTGKKDETAIIFNKVETVEKGYVDKKQKKIEKKKSVKGNLTPLTGKNYRQLLERMESRKVKLEKLRETNEGKAKEMEEKMKWTNVLYKAEGLKIKDNEDMLRASLKRKEKMRSQRKKRWDERSLNVVEKIQQRQDKRRKNIQKRKNAKIEKKKEKARKKGRVLPEDLEKATL